MRIQGHRIIVEKSYWIHQPGVAYSLVPWGSNDQYFHGRSEPVDIDLEDGFYLAESNLGDTLIYGTEEFAYTLQEAIDLGIAKVKE